MERKELEQEAVLEGVPVEVSPLDTPFQQDETEGLITLPSTPHHATIAFYEDGSVHFGYVQQIEDVEWYMTEHPEIDIAVWRVGSRWLSVTRGKQRVH